MRHGLWTKVRETVDKWAEWKVFFAFQVTGTGRTKGVCLHLSSFELIYSYRACQGQWITRLWQFEPTVRNRMAGSEWVFGQYTNSLATISVAKWREFYALAPTQGTQSWLRLHCGEYKNNLFWLNHFAKSFNHRKGLSVRVMLQIPSDAYVKYLWCVPTWHI